VLLKRQETKEAQAFENNEAGKGIGKFVIFYGIKQTEQ
jgi:hypothetical protein